MKTVIFCSALLATTLMSGPRLASAEAPASAADAALFERIDANHDGQVAADEVSR